MKKYFLSTLALLFLWTQPLLASSVSDFAYYKTINGNNNYSGSAWVVLDEDVYNHSNYSDLRIFSNAGVETPYRLFNNDRQDYSPLAKIIANSSQRQDYRGQSFAPANVFDGDITTFYEPDWQRDQGESWLIIDLQKETLVDELQLFISGSGYNWESLKIESSSNNGTYSSVNNFSRYTPGLLKLPQVLTRYIKLTFKYDDSLQIGKMNIAGSGNSKLLFFHQPRVNYQLFYGEIAAQAPDYNTDSLSISKGLPIFTLSNEQTNTNYNKDQDGDGISNDKDNCPLLSNFDQKDSDNDTIGDVCDNAPNISNKIQTDADKDGVGDEDDNCRYIKNPDQLDTDLDGIGWVCDDQDSDGVINSQDNCVLINNYRQEDINNNGKGDACEEDWDVDGIPQAIDNCRNEFNPIQTDKDNDGIGDQCDNCRTLSNKDQSDVNEDGIGDACSDIDGDGVFDTFDNCKQIVNADQSDMDSDGAGDVCDNCRDLKNSNQADENKDGIGDLCDDNDQDGVMGYQDNCNKAANADQKDSDNDGVGDACEDTDDDGVIDGLDNCRNKTNRAQLDEDKDGVGNACDDEDNRFTEQYSWLMWIIVVIAIAVIGFFAFRLLKKADKDMFTE